MSVLEIKQQVSRLSKRDRQEVYAYMVRLKHDTPEWKRVTTQRINAMQAGRRVSMGELATRVKRGR
jgi:hypothetical protein